MRTSIAVVLAVTLFILLASSESSRAGPAPIPQVKGKQIVNQQTGRVWQPQGVNWPSFEYACQQGWGYSNQGTDRRAIRAIASWSIDTVRLPLNQDCWLGDDGLPAGSLTVAGYRRAVRSFVNDLNSAGIAVVLDLHWSGPNGVVADGLRPTPDARSVPFWRSVATTFKSNRSVMFDLFNEPHSRWSNARARWVFSLSWSCWARGGCSPPVESDLIAEVGGQRYRAVGMRHLLRTVRKTGAKQAVIISGIDYANDIRNVSTLAPRDRSLIAGFHVYPVQNCRSRSCWDQQLRAIKGKMPVLATEVGQNNCRYDHVGRFVNWADQRRIGYLTWAWWSLPGTGCRNYALVKTLDGAPTAGYGQRYRAHLLRR